MEGEISLGVDAGEEEGEGEIEGESFELETNLNEKKTDFVDSKEYGAGKPQVWVRLRPPCSPDDNVIEIGSDEKSLRLVNESKELTQKPKLFETKKDEVDKGLIFKTDGILLDSTQEDIYTSVVNEVVEKALLKGVSGTIVSLGPNQSGKSVTIFGFGNLSDFQYRGVIPRALERIFELVESKCNQFVYLIRLGMIEVRKDRIRDLLTLGPYELQQIGENGPHGMLLQQIGCAEHGLGLLIRGLTGQKNFPRECYIRYHTIVYIDVHGEGFDDNGEHQVIKSRITFAKIASMPRRNENSTVLDTSPCEGFEEVSPTTPNQVPTKPCRSVRDPLKNTANMYNKDGPMLEDIAVRRDLFFLEQMFIRANELRKVQRLYSKLQNIGMTKMMNRPKSIPSQYFRQSKLAHCLQDIVAGTTEIRIILHIRPDKKFFHTALAALRFAERAKCLPHDVVPEHTKREEERIENLKNEIAFLKAELEAQELAKGQMIPDSSHAQLDHDQLNLIQQTAYDYLEGRIDEIKIVNKLQVTATFESFRQIWRDRDKDIEGKGQPDAIVAKTREQGDTIAETQASMIGKPSKSEVQKKKEKGRKRKDNARNSETPQLPLTEEINPANSETQGGKETVGQNNPAQSSPDDKKVSKPTSQSQQKAQLASQQRSTTAANNHEIKETPTKAEAWNAFLETNQGQNALEDENEAFLNASETDIDILQQEQLLGEDEYNDIVVTTEEKEILHEIKALQMNRDELLERLRNIRMQLYSNNEEGSIRQIQCNSAFEAFCSNRYGVVFGEDGTAVSTNQEPSLEDDLCTPHTTTMAELMTQNEEEAGKQFDNLKRLAKEQAKEFLKLYPKRPPWASNW